MDFKGLKTVNNIFQKEREEGLKNWGKMIYKAREKKLLTEDILFLLYHSIRYDIWHLNFINRQSQETCLLPKFPNKLSSEKKPFPEEKERLLVYNRALLKPILKILKEDFSLEPSGNFLKPADFEYWAIRKKEELIIGGCTITNKPFIKQTMNRWDKIQALKL